jgi:hypothetical protein
MPFIDDPFSKSLAREVEEICSISRKAEAAMLSSVIRDSQYAHKKLYEDALQSSRIIKESFLSPSVRYADVLSHLDHAATLGGRAAAQEFARGIPKQFLDSQLYFRSQVASYKSVCDSAIASLLSDSYTLANSIGGLQKAWDIGGVTRELFLEGYSKAIQTISESIFPHKDLMFESVRRVFDIKNDALMKAAQLANQSVLRDFLSITPAIINRSHIAFPADLIHKASSPFVQEWATLVCEARLVAIDIDNDEDHLLYAEYDRETVIELLAARLALEETQPEASISSSGDLEEPNGLFKCSGDHDDHYAHYHGETVLNFNDNSDSTKKALSQYLDELRQKGTFTEEEWEQIETDARRAEMFVRENFGDVMHVSLVFLMELSVLYVKENPISAEEFRERQEKALAGLRKLLPKLDGGRPEGTGLFRNKDDFQMALKDVLENAHKKPSQREALHSLRQHALCRKQTKEYPSQNETKTLRNWLKKCGITYKEALEKYWEPLQNGK